MIDRLERRQRGTLVERLDDRWEHSGVRPKHVLTD
jgi:hypothetical protein